MLNSIKHIVIILCIVAFYVTSYSQNSLYDDSFKSDVLGDIEFVFETNQVSEKGNVYAVVVPCSSLGFSSKDAVKAYSYLSGNSHKNIIFIGSSNSSFVVSDDFYETPLGQVNINNEISNMVSKEIKSIKSKKSKKVINSLSKHLLFIQYIFNNNISVVPILLDLNRLNKNLIKDLMKINFGDDTVLIITEDIANHINFTDNLDVITIKSNTDRNLSEWKVLLKK